MSLYRDYRDIYNNLEQGGNILRIKRILILTLSLILILPVKINVLAKSRLDMVFIIDRSGSMGDDIQNVKNNISQFTNNLKQKNIDYRLGLISYEQDTVVYDMTNNVEIFKNNLNAINVTGGTENGLDGIKDALDKYYYYANSIKYFVLIGDEPIYSDHGYSDEQIINELKSEGVILTAIGTEGMRTQYSKFTDNTRGKFLNLNNNFSNLLGEIFEQIHNIPNVAIKAPSNNQWLNDTHTNFIPRVTVSDPDSDRLTFSYFIDNETTPRDTQELSNTKQHQTVNLKAFDAQQLSEGNHKLTVKVSDVYDTVTDYVDFKVDKTAPITNETVASTDSSITINGNANDNFSGLANLPYRYTINNTSSNWTNNNQYTINNLKPNTLYNTTFEAKDLANNIKTNNGQIATLAQIPSFTVTNKEATSLTLKINDNNPNNTQYEVKVNDKYVNSSGNLSSSQTKILPQNKQITIRGLNANTQYNIEMKAINKHNIYTASTKKLCYTKPNAPTGIMLTPSQESISIKWNEMNNISNYVVKINNQTTVNVSETNYVHTGLTTETNYTFSVAAKNEAGIGTYSSSKSIMTLPYPPSQPVITSNEIKQDYIKLSWDSVPNTDSYEIEVDGTIVSESSTTYIHNNLSQETVHNYRVRAKNRGGCSSWTPLLSLKTLPYPPAIPQLVNQEIKKNHIILNWQAVDKAEGYQLKVDDLIIDLGNVTTYKHDNLKPLTDHTYEIRGYNIGGNSNWSDKMTIKTYPEEPKQPNNILATANENSITLTWYQVEYAKQYEIMIDNDKTEIVNECALIHKNLDNNEQHQYKIRAVNISGKSEWSTDITSSTLPKNDGEQNAYALTNMVAVVTNNQITLSWDAIDEALEYEVEVDGEIKIVGAETVYNHTKLNANEFHTYKVRIRNENNNNRWCSVLSLSTLPDPPDAPTNIEIEKYIDKIELRWDQVNNASSYEIEVDGSDIIIKADETYIHESLESGTNHTYRIRAKNITGVTAWSDAINVTTKTPDYTVAFNENEEFVFSVLANNVQDFNQLLITIEYDPSDITLVDLFSGTLKQESQTGEIDGTPITATVEDGKIILKSSTAIVPGTSWSGEITSIKFKALKDGESKIKLLTSKVND
jgi:hypothetical protein